MSLVMVAVVALALAGAPVASAAPKSVDRFIGGGNGGQGGQFFQPRGVGVYEATGDIYVADASNHRIARYSSEGLFERAWGRDVVIGGGTGFEVCTVAASCQAGTTGTLKGEMNVPVSLAVDQSDGSVYVHDQGNRRVQRFDLDGTFVLTFGKAVNVTVPGDVCTQASLNTCQAGTTGSAAGQFANNSTGAVTGRAYLAMHPSTDDVFVADPGNRRVAQYESDGDFVRAWGFGVDTGGAAFEVCTTASACAAGLTAAGTANGQFGSDAPLHLAIDADGIIYASDSNLGQRIIRFDSDGFVDAPGSLLAPIMATDQTPAGPLYNAAGVTTTALAIDPDTGNLLVTRDGSSGETRIQQIATATATATETHAVGSGLTTIQGIAVDGTRDRIVTAYAATPPGQGFFLLDPDGPSTPVLTVSTPTAIDASSAVLHGSVDPQGLAAYTFEVSTNGVVWTAANGTPAPASPVVGAAPVNVSQAVTGLKPNTLYRARITVTQTVGGNGITTIPPSIVTNSAETTFVTDAVPPVATTLPYSNRTASSAVLAGEVNPNGLPTTYYFEYGPTSAYGLRAPMPNGDVGSGTSAVPVTQQVEGLAPGTTYHYRVVGVNAEGAHAGNDRTVTTLAAAPNGPPERAYELVTPTAKNGQKFGQDQTGGISDANGNGSYAVATGQASADGERVFYSTIGASFGDPGSNQQGPANLFERTGAGWAVDVLSPTLPIAAYGSGVQPLGTSPAVWSSDLAHMAFGSGYHLDEVRDTDPDANTGSPGYDLYLRSPEGAFDLVSCPGAVCAANVAVPEDGRAAAASSDLGRIAFETSEPMTTEAFTTKQVYVRDAEGMRLVSQGVPKFGGLALTPASCEGTLAAYDGTGRPGVVSDDGSRVFFTAKVNTEIVPGIFVYGPLKLYVRIDDTDTIEVSRTRTATASTVPADGFMGASGDGNRALFASSVGLTGDDANGQSDLYAWGYDPQSDSETLQRVAALPQVGGGLSPNGQVFVTVLGMSEDASRVYFLTRTTGPGRGHLYVATNPATGSGTVRYIATVHQVAVGTDMGCLSEDRAFTTCGRASSDGRYFAFDSLLPLTADDRDTTGASTCTAAAVGSGAIPSFCQMDTYLYDAEGDGGSGELVRASTGSEGPQGSAGSGQIGTNTGIGESSTQGRRAELTRQRNITDDGAVFFQTSERLTPDDHNSAQDVYEFKGGVVRLVSGGRSGEVVPSFFMGNSVDGRDVFISTAAGLVSWDTDNGIDIYDARVGGGLPAPGVLPSGCAVLAGGCQSGGAGAVSARPVSRTPGGGNASVGARQTLALSAVSARARRRAARTGRLALSVSASVAGRVTVVAQGRVGGKVRRVAWTSMRARGAGASRVVLRLSTVARDQLRSGLALRLSVRVTALGARPRTTTVLLAGRRS